MATTKTKQPSRQRAARPPATKYARKPMKSSIKTQAERLKDRKDKGKNYLEDKTASDKRMAKRKTKIEKSDAKKAGTGAKPKASRSKKVTQDNRKEANKYTREANKKRAKAGKPKTGGHSGVSVNNKAVSKGKVKAGEKVVKKALIKGAKTLAKRAGVLGMGASLAADLVDSQKPKTFRNRKMVKKKAKGNK